MLFPLDVRHAASLLATTADLALETSAAAGRRPARVAAPPGPTPPAAATLVATPRLRTARRTPSAARRPRARRAPVAGYAPQGASTRASSRSSGAARSSSTSAHDPLAFLKDKGLSIEEKLIKLLGYLNAQWEKELQHKLDAIAAGEAKKKSSSSGSSSPSKKKSGGLLGSLGGLGEVVQAVVAPTNAVLKVPVVQDLLAQVSGPVLAAGTVALGFPELAPLALKYGPELVKGATSLLAALDGEGAPSGGGSGSSGSRGSGSSGGAAATSDADRQTLLLEIQRIQQKQQEMLGLVSNVLKTNHDARLAVISNIR